MQRYGTTPQQLCPPTSAHSAWQQLTLSLLLQSSYQYVANPCHLLSKEFDVCFVANWVLLEPLDAKLSSPVTWTWNWETLNSVARRATSLQSQCFEDATILFWEVVTMALFQNRTMEHYDCNHANQHSSDTVPFSVCLRPPRNLSDIDTTQHLVDIMIGW